jgi:mutator protein MutT
MIDVVAGCIIRDNKVLLAKRKSGNLKDKWEFPGGKKEDDESFEDALKREIFEELSIKIEVLEKIGEKRFSTDDEDFVLHLYNCRHVGGKINLSVHSKVVWIKYDDIFKFDMPSADKYFIKNIERYFE